MNLRTCLTMTMLTLASAYSAGPLAACPPGGGFGGYSYSAPRYYPSTPQYVPTTPRVSTATPVTTQTRTTSSSTSSRAVQQAAAQAAAATKLRADAAKAKVAFTARNYGTALTTMNAIVKQLPGNSEALQFRSMIHFALGDYKPAAADAYEAMKFGAVWNSESLAGLYGDMNLHARQLKMLEAAADDQPGSLEVHFLLAYQKLVTGDLKAGEAALETVLTIKPEEPLTAKLLDAVRTLQQQQPADAKSVAATER